MCVSKKLRTRKLDEITVLYAVLVLRKSVLVCLVTSLLQLHCFLQFLPNKLVIAVLMNFVLVEQNFFTIAR